jgi:hypothetical protein
MLYFLVVFWGIRNYANSARSNRVYPQVPYRLLQPWLIMNYVFFLYHQICIHSIITASEVLCVTIFAWRDKKK